LIKTGCGFYTAEGKGGSVPRAYLCDALQNPQ
jgi:hypothetical protein